MGKYIKKKTEVMILITDKAEFRPKKHLARQSRAFSMLKDKLTMRKINQLCILLHQITLLQVLENKNLE